MAEAVVSELADLLWERVLARDPLTALRLGRQVGSLPPGGQDAMERDVSFAVSALGWLAGADGADAAFLRDHLHQEIAEAQRFWYRFPVTPYNALPLSTYRQEIFEAAELTTAASTSSAGPWPEPRHACATAASCPSPRSPANCCAMRSTIQARRSATT